MSNSPRKNNRGQGRKKLYGEETEVYSVVVPKSKKQEIKTFVENLLKSYRVEQIKK